MDVKKQDNLQEEERPEVKAELEIEKITDGYVDCDVKLTVAERQGK